MPTNLCSAGNPSPVSGTGPWTWNCNGINGGTSSQCTANALSISANVVSYYKFETLNSNVVVNEKGQNNGMAYAGANLVASKTGTTYNFGNAISFNGANQYVLVPTTGLPTTDFTYSAFIKMNTVNDEMLFMSGGATNEFYIWISSGRIVTTIKGTGVLTSNTLLIANTWYHIAATWDSSTIKIYINGKLSKQSVYTITDWNHASGNTSIRLAIGTLYPYGTWAGNTAYSFNGLIDEVNYYKYVLYRSNQTTLGLAE